jgi:hypothetical protein
MLLNHQNPASLHFLMMTIVSRKTGGAIPGRCVCMMCMMMLLGSICISHGMLCMWESVLTIFPYSPGSEAISAVCLMVYGEQAGARIMMFVLSWSKGLQGERITHNQTNIDEAPTGGKCGCLTTT